MTAPCRVAGLPPPAPYPHTAAGRACCRTHFSAWQAIYRHEWGTHLFLHKLDCSSWPQGQRTTQEGRDEAHKTSQLQLKLKPLAVAPSQPWPTKKWCRHPGPSTYMSSFSLLKSSGVSLISLLSTIPHLPRPVASVYPSWPQSGNSGEWDGRGSPTTRTERTRTNHNLMHKRREACSFWNARRGAPLRQV